MKQKKYNIKTDELKNDKENYKENKFFNKKQAVNFRKGAIRQGVNTWAWKYLHLFQTKHNTCGTIVCFYMIMSLIMSRVIFHYFLYLSNIIILHEVHLLSNYTFPTQELIFESFALPSLENTIGTISPFLFAINHRKSCSKRHLKILSCSILTCVRACLRACVFVF